MNLVEFYNKQYSLKGEVCFNLKKFCFSIIKLVDGKAVDTKQFYLSFSEGTILFSDIISEKFWLSDIRYPEKNFRSTKNSERGGYRDLLITREGCISIINGDKTQVLRFNLKPFQMAEMAQALLGFLQAHQLAWAIKSK